MESRRVDEEGGGEQESRIGCEEVRRRKREEESRGG